jgi:hypothetical protein
MRLEDIIAGISLVGLKLSSVAQVIGFGPICRRDGSISDINANESRWFFAFNRLFSEQQFNQ